MMQPFESENAYMSHNADAQHKTAIPKLTGRGRGGLARAKSQSPERLSEIGRKGATARWGAPQDDGLPMVISGSPDRPLKLGDVKIPCYVLSDRRRVLVQRGLQSSIGMSTSGGSSGAQRLAVFIESLAQKGVNCSDLASRIRDPIRFRSPGIAYGYEATIINDICDAVLEARRIKVLHPQQEPFARQCEVLVSGLARIGIVEMVDRATGYDKVRARENLEEILEKFVAKELQKWIKTFPDDYYDQIFRLNNWNFVSVSGRKPGVVGHWTNDIVWDRLAPGLLDELRRLTPRNERGRLKHPLGRRLTPDFGHPKLKEHLSAVVALMRAGRNWKDFYWLLDRAFPRFNETLQLPFDDAPAMEAIPAPSPPPA